MKNPIYLVQRYYNNILLIFKAPNSSNNQPINELPKQPIQTEGKDNNTETKAHAPISNTNPIEVPAAPENKIVPKTEDQASSPTKVEKPVPTQISTPKSQTEISSPTKLVSPKPVPTLTPIKSDPQNPPDIK